MIKTLETPTIPLVHNLSRNAWANQMNLLVGAMTRLCPMEGPHVLLVDFNNGGLLEVHWPSHTPEEVIATARERGLLAPAAHPDREALKTLVTGLPDEILEEALRMMQGLVVEPESKEVEVEVEPSRLARECKPPRTGPCLLPGVSKHKPC